MSEDDKGAPKRPPPPIPSAPVKPPPPQRSAAHELDAGDLLSDEVEAVPPATPVKSVEGDAAVSPPAPAPPHPFLLPPDAQPPTPRRVEPAATASIANASPPGEPKVGARGVTPKAEPAPREDLASAPRKRSRAMAIVFLLLAVVAIGGVFAYRAKVARDEQARVASEPVRQPEPATPALPSNYVEPAPPPTHSSPPPPETSAAAKGSAKIPQGRTPEPAASIPPNESGIVDTTALPAGRKIIVNGRFVGLSPRRVPVRCGTIRVQIGDLPTESIAMPCGGEVSFTDN